MTLLRFWIDLEDLANALERGAWKPEQRRATWLVRQICDVYADGDRDSQSELRHVLTRHATLRSLFSEAIAHAAADLDRDPSPRHLRRGLVAAVLADRRPDERVWSRRVHELVRTPALAPRVVATLWEDAIAAATSAPTRRLLQLEDRRRREIVTAAKRHLPREA